MAAGLPILSSDRGPMLEILGETGVYFNPEKPESLCTALLNLFASGERMTAYAKATHQKAKAFSWHRCAADTFGFLRHIAKMYGQVE